MTSPHTPHLSSCCHHHVTVTTVSPSLSGSNITHSTHTSQHTHNTLTTHSQHNRQTVITCTSIKLDLIAAQKHKHFLSLTLNLQTNLNKVMHLKITHHTNPGYLASMSKDVCNTFLVAGGVVAVLDEGRQQLLVPGGGRGGTPLSVYGAQTTQQHLGVCTSTPSTWTCFKLCIGRRIDT